MQAQQSEHRRLRSARHDVRFDVTGRGAERFGEIFDGILILRRVIVSFKTPASIPTPAVESVVGELAPLLLPIAVLSVGAVVRSAVVVFQKAEHDEQAQRRGDVGVRLRKQVIPRLGGQQREKFLIVRLGQERKDALLTRIASRFLAALSSEFFVTTVNGGKIFVPEILGKRQSYGDRRRRSVFARAGFGTLDATLRVVGRSSAGKAGGSRLGVKLLHSPEEFLPALNHLDSFENRRFLQLLDFRVVDGRREPEYVSVGGRPEFFGIRRRFNLAIQRSVLVFFEFVEVLKLEFATVERAILREFLVRFFRAGLEIREEEINVRASVGALRVVVFLRAGSEQFRFVERD